MSKLGKKQIRFTYEFNPNSSFSAEKSSLFQPKEKSRGAHPSRLCREGGGSKADAPIQLIKTFLSLKQDRIASLATQESRQSRPEGGKHPLENKPNATAAKLGFAATKGDMAGCIQKLEFIGPLGSQTILIPAIFDIKFSSSLIGSAPEGSQSLKPTEGSRQTILINIDPSPGVLGKINSTSPPKGRERGGATFPYEKQL